MSFRGWTALVLATLAALPLGIRQPAWSQDSVILTRIEARAFALESGPPFQAARATGEAARGAARTDRVYPFNPTVEWKGVEALDPGENRNYEAVVSQQIEWAGQWWVRRNAGAKAMDAASLDEADAIRLLLRNLDLAFFGLQAAQERQRVAEAGAETARTLREAVQTQLEEGQVSALEMNLASIEAGRAQARALAARNDLLRAKKDLREMLGLDPEIDLAVRSDEAALPETGTEGGLYPAFDITDPESLIDEAVIRRPDLQAARAREEEAASRRRLAAMEAIPNLELGAVADRGGPQTDRTLGIRVALPIPLWNRNQGQREEARGQERLRQVERHDLEIRVRGEVLTALEAFRTASEELDLFTTTVLEPAQENRQLVQTAYGSGHFDLPTTLLLQSQLVEAEMAFWDAWERQRMALAELEAAGGIIPET